VIANGIEVTSHLEPGADMKDVASIDTPRAVLDRRRFAFAVPLLAADAFGRP
jgi:hypothetical protein